MSSINRSMDAEDEEVEKVNEAFFPDKDKKKKQKAYGGR